MISLSFLVLAGILKAAMDVIQFHFYESVFRERNRDFWAPTLSWRNKWKDGEKAKGEKFFLSSTMLVFTTDAWHLLQFFFLTAIALAVVFYDPIRSTPIDFAIYRVVFSIVFEVFFSKIFIKG